MDSCFFYEHFGCFVVKCLLICCYEVYLMTLNEDDDVEGFIYFYLFNVNGNVDGFL